MKNKHINLELLLTTLFKEIEEKSEKNNLLRIFNNRDNKKELFLFYQN